MDAVGASVVVLYEGSAAKKFHQELFSLPDTGYYAIEGAVTDAVLDASRRSPGELHIVAKWETIILLASWNGGAPSATDIPGLFGGPCTGTGHGGLESSDIPALFYPVCRSERYDLLRRICRAAKSRTESICGEGVSIHCHVASDEAGKIVASSL